MEALITEALLKGAMAAGFPCLLLLGAVIWLSRRQEVFIKMIVDNQDKQIGELKLRCDSCDQDRVKLHDKMFNLLTAQRDYRRAERTSQNEPNAAA